MSSMTWIKFSYLIPPNLSGCLRANLESSFSLMYLRVLLSKQDLSPIFVQYFTRDLQIPSLLAIVGNTRKATTDYKDTTSLWAWDRIADQLRGSLSRAKACFLNILSIWSLGDEPARSINNCSSSSVHFLLLDWVSLAAQEAEQVWRLEITWPWVPLKIMGGTNRVEHILHTRVHLRTISYVLGSVDFLYWYWLSQQFERTERVWLGMGFLCWVDRACIEGIDPFRFALLLCIWNGWCRCILHSWSNNERLKTPRDREE